MSDSDSDDVPTLSAHTLAALQEFYQEARGEPVSAPSDQFSVGALEEDWVSQPLLIKGPVCKISLTLTILSLHVLKLTQCEAWVCLDAQKAAKAERN